MMKIAIIGSGHVGLVTGAGFADLGNEVICVDQDMQKIKRLRRGQIPFYEPGLLELVQRNRRARRLVFSTSIREAVQSATIIFICVGTPSQKNGEADLSAIEHVANSIAQNLRDYRLIVEKSTVPVETGEQLCKTITERNRKKVSFDVASNPEFLSEGTAVSNFFNPDRIILGVESDRAKKILCHLYKPFKAPVLITDIKSAELIKHASNSFLATKISFINLVSQISSKVGADINKVAEGMGADPRIGKPFLNAGVGFGGFCFPKDLAAFIRIGEKLGVPCNFLHEVLSINESQKANFIRMAERALWNLRGKTVGVLGLAFKPNTDDMRFAPSVDIIKQLQEKGVIVRAYDPFAMREAKKILNGVKLVRNEHEACRGADAALIMTEWREFRELDLKRLKRALKHPIIVDGRNMYDPAVMKKNGFRYYSVGR